jgi:hypothetical protein
VDNRADWHLKMSVPARLYPVMIDAERCLPGGQVDRNANRDANRQSDDYFQSGMPQDFLQLEC